MGWADKSGDGMTLTFVPAGIARVLESMAGEAAAVIAEAQSVAATLAIGPSRACSVR